MELIIPVILLNWNGIDDSIACIHSLLKQQGVDVKIYVGDNNSDNDEGQQLVNRFAQHQAVTVVCNADNLGFAKGCNALMQQAMDEYPEATAIALLNNDAVAEPNWLKTMYATMQAQNAGMIGSKMITYDDHNILDNVGHKMITTGEVVPIGHRESVDHYADPIDVFGVCAGAVMYRRSMLEDIGLFDPYFSTGYEDAELGIRAVVAGYRCIYEPSAVVYHKVSQSVNKIFNFDYVVMIQRSIYYSYFKLMPMLTIVVNLPAILLKLFLMGMLNTVTSDSKHNKLHIAALKTTWRDRALIKQSRKAFYKNRKVLGALAIRKRQQSWITFDFGRFWKYRVQGNPSQFNRVD